MSYFALIKVNLYRDDWTNGTLVVTILWFKNSILFVNFYFSIQKYKTKFTIEIQ